MSIVSHGTKRDRNPQRSRSGHSGHFSEGNRGSGQKSAQAAVLATLDKIQPADRPTRFLQAWAPDQQHIIFGYGDGEHGVLFHGDGLIEEAIDSARSRFTTGVLKREPPEGRRIFEQVRSLLNAFVHFDDPRVASLVTLWIMGTYLYTTFSHFGYLFFHSKLPRSGKTRVLEMISHLAFEATAPLNAPTTATIRELACEGRTLQLDTLERWRGKSAEAFCAAMELLDAGFRNGGTVSKMVPLGDGNWRRGSYPVYAPYSMAAIDKDSLSDTALDRSFAIEMRRKAIKVQKNKYNFHRVERLCQPTREDLYLWALLNAGRVAEIYESAEHETFVSRIQLHDRAADIWKPLLAIARLLDLDLPDLSRLAHEMSGDPDAQEDRRRLSILDHLLTMLDDGEVIGTTTELRAVQGFVDVYDTLTAWGFVQEKRWIGGQSSRVWVLPEQRLVRLARELRESQHGYYPQESDQSDQNQTARGFSPRTGDAYAIQ
jgi:hypothetical protein